MLINAPYIKNLDNLIDRKICKEVNETERQKNSVKTVSSILKLFERKTTIIMKASKKEDIFESKQSQTIIQWWKKVN